MRYEINIFVFVIVLVGAFGGGYFLGKAHREIEYIEKEVEVVKYVEKNKAIIAAKPNANRDDILKLMRAGKL